METVIYGAKVTGFEIIIEDFMRKLTFLENCSELGAGTRGSSLGVKALKMAAINKGSSIFEQTEWVRVKDKNDDVLMRPIRYPFAKKIDAMVEMYNRISSSTSEILQNGSFPIVLSGDHSNAGGTISGIKMAYPNKRLGVIWIDAHADIHSPYTTPSGNLHGMPLAAAMGLGKPENPLNNPDEVTCVAWENLCSVGNIKPKVNPEDIVYIDIRDLEPEEWKVIRDKNIRYYEPHDIKEKKIAGIVRETLDYLSACDLIYVSFDVDSMDPTISVGTGTPVANGLKEEDALDLLLRLWREPRLVCLEITEINPLLDTRNRMAETVVEFITTLTREPV